MGIGSQRSVVADLLKNSDLTSAEIIEKTGITYGAFYSMFNRTKVDERDTEIRIYRLVGHDGSDPKDKCAVCGIVLLKDYSIVPDNWGEFQRESGNICVSCEQELMTFMPDAMNALLSTGCAICKSKEVKLYFYTKNTISTSQALPLCKEHRRVFYEEKIEKTLRYYHGRISSVTLFHIITGENILPGWDDMYICDCCGYMSAWDNMSLPDEDDEDQEPVCPSCAGGE